MFSILQFTLLRGFVALDLKSPFEMEFVHELYNKMDLTSYYKQDIRE